MLSEAYFRKESGVTLVEIVIAILLVAIFSIILIANFPEIQKRYALSGATYKMAQDFRKVEDLGFSALQLNDKNGNSLEVKGYGIYVNLDEPAKYIIYADVGEQANQGYDGNFLSTLFCNNQEGSATDCIIETVDVSAGNSDLYIKAINNVSGATSINFNPPSPTTSIQSLNPGESEVGIVLGLHSDESLFRTILVNKSGLISVE